MTNTLSPVTGSPASMKNEYHDASSSTTQGTVPPTARVKPPTKSKPRKRVNTAEKRHQHNAIERQRRETLNGKFISLARLLPSLATVRRPSKSATVNGSIAHLTYQRDQRLLAAKLLRQVCSQHDQLLREVNEWRKASGYAPKDVAPAWTDDMDEVCAVEKEVFGNFANVDGDDNDNDNDEDEDGTTDGVYNNSVSTSYGALITPRSSADMDAMPAALSMFMSQNQIPVQQQQAQRTAAALNGLSWAQGYSTFTNSIPSSTSSLPFNAFMSDSLDQSSTGSPANSIQGNVLTPPTTADPLSIYTHTPSPRSSNSLGDDSSASAAPVWGEQQLMFLQQHQQHNGATMPSISRHHSMSTMSSSGATINTHNLFRQSNNSNTNNSAHFNHLFAQQAQTHVPQAQALLSAASGSDAFTQSLLASMFPSQGVSSEQVDQWRKLALAGLSSQTSPTEAVPTVRPGAGLRMNSMWEASRNHAAVEGF